MTEQEPEKPSADSGTDPRRRADRLIVGITVLAALYPLSFLWFYVVHSHEFSKALPGDPWRHLVIFSDNTTVHVALRRFYAPLVAITSNRKHVPTSEEHEGLMNWPPRCTDARRVAIAIHRARGGATYLSIADQRLTETQLRNILTASHGGAPKPVSIIVDQGLRREDADNLVQLLNRVGLHDIEIRICEVKLADCPAPSAQETLLGIARTAVSAVAWACLLLTITVVALGLKVAATGPTVPPPKLSVRLEWLMFIYTLANIPIVFRKRPVYTPVVTFGTVAGFGLVHWSLLRLGVTPEGPFPVLWYGFMLFAVLVILLTGSQGLQNEWLHGRHVLDEVHELTAQVSCQNTPAPERGPDESEDS